MHSLSTPILLVDDNQLSRQLLARALEKAGFSVVESARGSEALALVQIGDPMLLVLDYDMPELNGAEVCSRVRGNVDPGIATLPIILLTAHAGEDHEVECLGAGADDFVTKPVNIVILKARIETQLRLHFLRAQLREQNAELERWRDRHELDLGAAQLTQQAILPSRAPAMAGWQVAAHYQPLIQVGGDIYDWVRLPDGRWLVWIADATGHGAAAALLTTLTKLVFIHAATEGLSASQILEAVNADVFAVFKGRSYLTAACLVVTPDSDEISFAGAGHPPLLIARRDGRVDFLSSEAPPIGFRAHLNCQEFCAHVETGETLLLYTDGLYSMNDDSGEPFTHTDAPKFLPRSTSSGLDFVAKTLGAVNRRAAGGPLSDDLALVALRRL